MGVKKKEFVEVYPGTRKRWRSWLAKHHDQKESIWLILDKKEGRKDRLTVAEAVEEALCFGWIDSVANKMDDQRYKLTMSPRNPKSKWSKINKDRVKQLIEKGLMTEAGMKMVRLAKKTGTWTALNHVDKLIIPEDLKQALANKEEALTHFNAFPASARRGILEWIMNAKREETRAKRIQETVSLAAQNIRANQYVKK